MYSAERLSSLANQGSADPAITTNNTDIRQAPSFGVLNMYWVDDPEMQRHYWTASFLLPIGPIFVLALVVLLMVLFKRCPHMVAAMVASILGVIIIFAALISLNHGQIYS